MIPIKNIYYMLKYAFDALREKGVKSLDADEFDGVGDLCAAILLNGVYRLLKKGVGREYIETTDMLYAIKGKIDVTNTIKTNNICKNKIICQFDSFSENYFFNQIIKTTMVGLLKNGDVKTKRKKELKKALLFFEGVDVIDIKSIRWKFNYNRNNSIYRMLIGICYLAINNLLLNNKDGHVRTMDFDQKDMARLYEKFLLEYCKKHFKNARVSSSEIKWKLDNEFDDQLPNMFSDVMIESKNKVLIIDAKYYTQSMACRYQKNSIHSANLYQIFAYVKNKQFQLGNGYTVSGVLLYAKTNEDEVPSADYQMSGNKISAKTLDLNCDFCEIERQIHHLVKYYLEI